MDEAELQQLLCEGESATVEFKKFTSLLREALESLCAFANHHGGYNGIYRLV